LAGGFLGLALAGLTAALLGPGPARAEVPAPNGFSLENASVPVDEIRRGGPPRDGIPALDHPKVLSAEQARWPEDALVLGVERGGEARAYPVAILDWHELVNDTVGGEPLLISYCPLCGTGMVFDRRVSGQVHSFGVSGLLYQSDVLMYDHETDSLWSQISSEAISGPSRGQHLRLLRSQMARWGQWKRAHPHTTVLSRQTGYRRDYGRSPYGRYAESPLVHFPVHFDPRYHPKTPTLGLAAPDGRARAYPANELERAGGSVKERFAGKSVQVTWDAHDRVFDVKAPQSIAVVQGYWFAWSAFHPNSSVFVATPVAESTLPGKAR